MVAIGCNAMIEKFLLKHGYIATTILHSNGQPL